MIEPCPECGTPCVVEVHKSHRHYAPTPAQAEALAAGVKAGIILRLIAGNTDQTYTPTEVSSMVAEVVDEQMARLIPGTGET